MGLRPQNNPATAYYRAQLAALQAHLITVIRERDVLREANNKKHKSIISLSKRLRMITELMEGKTNGQRN